LENLAPGIAERKWEVLKSASPEEFGILELNVLKLVFSYCCYFKHNSPTPSPEFRSSNKEGYYSLAKKIAKKGKLRNINVKVSSIIEDKKMAAIIQSMEQ
jgi:hypothetical protein